MVNNKSIPFRPKLEGEFRTRFFNAVSHISDLTTISEIESIVSAEVSWAEDECSVNLSQRRRYRAVWMLFRDLIRASWKASYKDGVLEMRLPSLDNSDLAGSSIPEKKNYMRSWMQESRIERLGLFSDFIHRMESKNSKGYSITDLIANGPALRDRLLSVKYSERKIEEVLQPYLQLVIEGEEDSYTGIKTSDIWRYCRLSWSTPSETTPGRTMQYLIRDAACLNHPIMGIASLENCAVQITCRDEYIGWNNTSYVSDLLEKNSADYTRKSLLRLISFINDGISGISYDNLCTQDETLNPTDDVIAHLQEIAEQAEEQRQFLLREREDDSEDILPENKSELGNISKDIEIALYTRKRADQLSKLLLSKKIISSILESDSFSEIWKPFVESENGKSAIRTALIAQKSKHIGSSMMELNVCGAIPPYNEVLGGKLVALLATSPQVINDYRERYSDRKSEIASRLKGEDVKKPADLVYIGTTSLYYVGSSQYNRLKIPGSLFGSNYDVRWKELGRTVGFGTLHISKATTSCLTEATDDGYSRINHVFGEGSSPKMRLMTMAIRELLETSDNDTKEFSKHAMSRIVFGAELAQNTIPYLLGEDPSPKYYYCDCDSENATKKIISYWRDRWVLSRLNHEPIFEKIRQFKAEDFLVSKLLDESSHWHFNKLKNPDCMSIPTGSQGLGLNFIRNFYRGNSAFADYVDDKLLTKVHVQTELDDAISFYLQIKKDVILTGNPGDGKTHIIRMLSQRFNTLPVSPVIELDASTLSNSEIREHWLCARHANKPFLIAINAAVLFSLAKEYDDTFIQDAKDQLLNSITYTSSTKNVSSVVVFDLSKRNVLTKKVIHSVIDNMTQEEHFSSCINCTFKSSCPALINAKLIRTEIFQERLSHILSRAALQGYHATLRELQSLCSYLIFGGRDCSDLPKTSSENQYDLSNLVYRGKGAIFNAIRRAFDPERVSHPYWDEKLIYSSQIDNNSWDDAFSISFESINPSNNELFTLRKRQFYFFNINGDSLLRIAEDSVSRFKDFLLLDEKEQLKDIIAKLNVFFGGNKTNSNLGIWTSHRFNNEPRKVLISLGNLARKHFGIGIPQLNYNMSEGIEFIPSYVRFYSQEDPTIFLKIDFEMYNLLLSAERGVPALMIESEDVKRIWRFMDQLKVDNEDDEITISLFDVQNKHGISIGIDTDSNKYISIENY